MTIDTAALTNRLRARADAAALASANELTEGHERDAAWHAGRQNAFLSAMGFLADAVTDAYAERDAVLRGASVDLGAVEDLEEFARHAGGAVDMASGTVYSDADGGL